jgi:hypothetical protein
MPLMEVDVWSDLLRSSLERYDEPLLRQTAKKLLRARNDWPAEELIERSLAAVKNPPVIERRLQEIDSTGRRLLALIAHSRQPRWRLGSLVELSVALGETSEPFRPILSLFEAGLLYPDLSAQSASYRLQSFEQTLALASSARLSVFAHPLVAARALSEDLDLPELPVVATTGTVHESDGLEWPLRLSALWQMVSAAPLRRTQNGSFFKRDLDRLRGDPVLNTTSGEILAELPDLPVLTFALADAEGIVRSNEGETTAGQLPTVWDDGLLRTLESLLGALFQLDTWDPLDGGRDGTVEGSASNPFPSAYLLALALLGRQPEDAFLRPDDIDAWLLAHLPYWMSEDLRPSRYRNWVGTFLLGVLYPLRLIQAAKDSEGDWLVRLSPLGRWLLGLGEAPPPTPSFPQTLLVQPNLEILAYRQGLTPGLIAKLAHFAAWKGLGAACLLQLQPETVYRALESGYTFETILQTLTQHGTRALPTAVVDSLRTWSNKRERISVYPAAALLEFANADDLNDALNRGLPALRLSERLALVAHADSIDFKHFTLAGTRDYGLPAERCVTVEPDGVTLTIDLSKSDLLLETELPRFALLLDRSATTGKRQYRITPASVTAGRESGMTVSNFESWFAQRTGAPLSPATRLLLTASHASSAELRRCLVLYLASAELADGVMQWPETRALVEERLGPTAIVVEEENVAPLREKLGLVGLGLKQP